MSITKIEPKAHRLELDKRTYLPFVVTATCPTCGKEETRDLTADYLSYPMTRDPEKVTFNHDEDGDGEYHEWPEYVIIGFTLEVSSPEEPTR